MKGTIAAFLIWTLVIIGGGVLLSQQVVNEIVDTGTTIRFQTSWSMVIEDSQTSLEANSCSYFALQNENGENIVGTPAPAPLGSPCGNQYYVFPRNIISGGKWIFRSGSANFDIQDDHPITVRRLNSDPTMRRTFLIVFAFVLWAAGLSVARDFSKRSSS